MKEFHIGRRVISQRQPCYIIAELGLNHNGKEGLAIKLVEEACKAGVDAIKVSRFDTHKLLSMEDTLVCDDDTCHKERSDDRLHQEYELSYETLTKIANLCRKLGIDFLSTPFDEENVDFLVQSGLPAIKIASGDLTNDPFLKYIAKQEKSVILSTGMSTLDEIKHAVTVLRENGCEELALLHCVTNYPAKPEELNLRVIPALAREFQIPIGFSDHTIGGAVAPLAVAAGACIIEKHFTLNKELPGPDHRFSLDPYEMGQMVRDIRRVEMILGVEWKDPTPAELAYRKFGRRSIVARVPIEANTVITEDMLMMKRPGTGISPRDLYKVLGRKAKQNIAADEILTWEKLE